jgi:hypothetical protein
MPGQSSTAFLLHVSLHTSMSTFLHSNLNDESTSQSEDQQIFKHKTAADCHRPSNMQKWLVSSAKQCQLLAIISSLPS